MTEKPKNTRWKIALDVLAVIALGYFLIGSLVWCIYDSKCGEHGDPGKMPIEIVLELVDFLPAVFGLLWLPYRYPDPRFMDEGFRIKFILGGASLYFIGYLILKCTVGR